MCNSRELRLERPDGREAITVSADDQFARFTLWRYSAQTEGHPYPDAGWNPVALSGIYSTPSEALTSAAQEHTWLRDMLSTAGSDNR